MTIAAAALLMAAATAAPDRTIKVGLPKSLLHDTEHGRFEVMAANFRTVMKEQTGLDGDLVEVDSADVLRQQLADGTLQLGAFQGHEFAWAKAKLPDLEPLMLASTNPDVLQPVVVVPMASQAKDIGELRGKAIALPTSARDCVRLFVGKLCQKQGAAMKDFFTSVQAPEKAIDALDDLVDGKVQAAAVTQSVMRVFTTLKPGRAGRLKVLAQSEPFPPAVIAYVRGKLDNRTVQTFRDGMSAAHKTNNGNHLISQIKV